MQTTETESTPVTMKAPNSEFLTRKEAAERLRCSVRTVDRWIKEEELRTKKIGGSRLIYKVSLEAFIETSN